MPKKTRAEKLAAKQERGTARREKKATRKTQRTENLAARKGITTKQAGQLQENRRVRLKEALSGGTENITTGRLRFSDPEPSMDKKASTSNATSPDAKTSTPSSGGNAIDRFGGYQDEMTGRGGNVYNRFADAGSVGSVEVGEGDFGISPDTGTDFSKRGSVGSGAYRKS